MKYNIKFQSIGTFKFEAENLATDFEMSAAADRQILGKALDNAENKSINTIQFLKNR